MRDGICPKCGSDEIYDDSSKTMFGTGENDYLGITATAQTRIQNYACADCGYTERYIKDDDGREKIRDKWNRTGKRKRTD